MPRASRIPNPPAVAAAAAAPAAAAKNVGSNAGHSNPSCGAPAHQPFCPVSRSMTRQPAPIAASPGLKEGGSASTSTRRSISDASFSIQSATSRPTVTHARTPHKVTSSGWKPLTQPVALSVERKCASPTTAKRSRVASSRVVKDSTTASKANTNVPSGNKYKVEENMSQADQLDGAIMPSPPKKLQTCKDPSDSPSIRKSTIRILGANRAVFLPTGKSEVETGEKFDSSASTNVISQSIDSSVPLLAQQPQPGTAKNFDSSASTNVISQSIDSSDPLLAQQPQPGTAKMSNAITQAIASETSQLNQLAAAVLPKQNLRTDYEKKPASLPIVTNQVSRLGGATAPLVAPKLEIGKVQNTSNLLSNPAYARALLIKQQEQLLQQFKLGTSQQQQHQHQHHIKGPALLETDEPPPVEPLGTRCQLCKLDVAFRPQGDAGRDANAPPVVAVLACHHAFHSSCIESIYGLAEPACLEHGAAH